MKSILIFIDWFFPGYKAGGPIRSIYNLADHLCDQYNFYLITRDTDYCDDKPYQEIQSDAWNELAPGLNVYYFSKENLSYKNIRSVIKSVDFDVAYINSMYSWYFAIIPFFILRNLNVRKIIAPRGMLSGQAFSSKNLKKRLFLTSLKMSGLLSGFIFQSTSKQEEIDIQKNFRRNVKILSAPNLPKKISHRKNVTEFEKTNELKLINVARISPEKNLMFFLNILKNSDPNMKIILDQFGPAYDKNYYDRCLEICSSLPGNIQVNFNGPSSPEQLEMIIRDYHFMVFPSFGENFGHSIYEALSAGIPVIISDQTPWKDLLKDKAGWDIPLNNPEKWMKVLEQCYNMDYNTYHQFSVGAINKAKEYVINSNYTEKYQILFEG